MIVNWMMIPFILMTMVILHISMMITAEVEEELHYTLADLGKLRIYS